jgi:hypothetical protein
MEVAATEFIAVATGEFAADRIYLRLRHSRVDLASSARRIPETTSREIRFLRLDPWRRGAMPPRERL